MPESATETKPKATELKGGPIARSNQLYIVVTEIGELGTNGKKLFSMGYKGKMTADPDKPLSTLAAGLLGEMLKTMRWSTDEAMEADVARFLKLIDNTFRPPVPKTEEQPATEPTPV